MKIPQFIVGQRKPESGGLHIVNSDGRGLEGGWQICTRTTPTSPQVSSRLDLPIQSYLRSFAHLYPDIDAWYAGVQMKVPSGKRSVFVISRNGAVCGLAITKNELDSKLCHISVVPQERGRGLGLQLMRAAAKRMTAAGARNVYVTTSDGVAHSYADFFERCGFAQSEVHKGRYHPGVSELVWTASMASLRAAI